MTSILIGSLLLSLLHAVIPNHWLPILAIARKEKWSSIVTMQVTFLAGLAHVMSTVIIGVLLSMIGNELTDRIEHFTHIIAPAVLVIIGLYFIQQHYRHRHFQMNNEVVQKKNKSRIILALVVAMFLSPCMEIEAYFLLAGGYGWWSVAGVALLYGVITIMGMLLWVGVVNRRLIKLNWHRWEHNAGIITGIVLIVTGILTFFIA